jgi:hypothetical protein
MFIIMPTAFSTIPTKPAEPYEFIRACGANDVDYYACGALNDFNKTCGALKLLKILRS